MHSRHLAEISWKGELTQEHVLCYAALWVGLGKAPGPCLNSPFHNDFFFLKILRFMFKNI